MLLLLLSIIICYLPIGSTLQKICRVLSDANDEMNSGKHFQRLERCVWNNDDSHHQDSDVHEMINVNCT